MWLNYGVDDRDSLVFIEEVPSGKTSVKCPYCKSALTAKKGRIKEHHFAHTQETCRFVASRNSREIPVLPLYDNFNLQLSAHEFERLKELWSQYGALAYSIPNQLVLPSFVYRRLLQENPYRPPSAGYEFTNLGKIPFGALSLMLFNQVQEPLLLEKLEELEQKTERAQLAKLSTLPERLTDLRIYRAQLKKILSTTLYYLEVQADEQTFYKIGVTQRSIEQRVAEVQSDLKKHFKAVSIEVLGTWEHRGNVEKYFKHRYQDFNHPIGRLTEYYKFNAEDAEIVLRDLRRMKLKEISQLETNILDGKPSPIERQFSRKFPADLEKTVRSGLVKLP